MKNWQKLALITISVGGGFAGAIGILPALSHGTDSSISHRVIRTSFFLLFCFIAVSGLRFAVDNKKISLLFVAFALQVFYVTSPQFSYKLAGFPLYILFGPGETDSFFMGFESYFGAEWVWGHTPDLPWRIGVNVVAIAMLIVLFYAMDAHKHGEKQAKASVDT